jgi:aspartyl-tRNA(Asn)/glutamyl-tRNA(Gln) amidotransferase subunit A
MLEVISGFNEKEGTTIKTENGYARNLNPDISGYKIGVVKEFKNLTDPKITKEIDKSIKKLEKKGAEIVEVGLPNLDKGLPTYYLTVFVEFFSATRKFDGRRYGKKIEDVCGREVLRRILLGKYISQKEFTGKYYKKALQFRSLIKAEVLEALKGVDVIAGPTVPKLPHKIGEEIKDPLVMYAYDVLTVPANLAGIPAGVIKAGEVSGVPVGLQIQGRPLEEQKILNAMQAFEEETK